VSRKESKKKTEKLQGRGTFFRILVGICKPNRVKEVQEEKGTLFVKGGG